MRLMITRPREDAATMATRLRDLGHEVLLEPLLEICFKKSIEVQLAGVAALLMTSANGVRAFANVCERRDIPLYAVGDATARMARTAGFQTVVSAAGDVDSLVVMVADALSPTDGRLVHAAGTRVAGDLHGQLSARGFQMDRMVLYDARIAEELTRAAADAIRNGQVDGVMFFSPRTATTFVTLAQKTGVGPACKDLTAYCLSPAVARAAMARPNDLTWRRVCAAVAPNEGSLLELLEAAS